MKATLIERGVGGPSVPVRAGFPIPRGMVTPGRAMLTVDGLAVPDAQVEELATWEDGSLAHAVFSWRQQLVAGDSVALDVIDADRPAVPEPWHPLVKKLLPLFDLEVAVTDAAGATWSLRAGPAEGAQALVSLMGGGPGAESRALEVLAPLTNLGTQLKGVNLRIRARFPTDTAGFGWQILLENCEAVAAIADFQFSQVTVRWGTDVRTVPGGLLQAGARLLFEGWAGVGAPTHDVVLDGRLLEDLMLAPPIEWDGPCSPTAGAALFQALARERDGSGAPARGPAPVDHLLPPTPGSAFPLYMNGGATGDRADIGPLPTWSIAYLNGGSPAACTLQRWADTHGSCAFPIHWRDPAQLEVGVRHGHPVWKGSATPDVGVKSGAKPDVAHHALVGALTWLATGDLTALEELRAWALLSVRLAYPNDGSLQTPGDRREAWALRTIAIAGRFSPDRDTFRSYFQGCLTKTAAEWAVALPRIQRECPLGNLHVGTWHPSGRDSSPCSYIGSLWQQAWFLFEALAADQLMGVLLFRPLVDHGWRWWLGFLDGGTTWDAPAGGQSRFTLDQLVDYSTPVGVFEMEVVPDPKTGRPTCVEKPGSWRPIDHLGELAWQARIYADHGKPAILPADLPPDPRPEYWRPDPEPWTPVVGSRWFEYGPGRAGIHLVGVRFGLPRAAEVAFVAAPLIAADHVSSKRATWARVRAA